MPITISLAPNIVDSSVSDFTYAVASLTFSGAIPPAATRSAVRPDHLSLRRIAKRQRRLLRRGAGKRDEQLEVKAFASGGTGATPAPPRKRHHRRGPAQHHRASISVTLIHRAVRNFANVGESRGAASGPPGGL